MDGMTTPNWREERRRDRLAAAQIVRDDTAARAQAGIADAEARARLQVKERQARQAARDAARKQRTVRRAERVAWLRSHVVDLLFVPVIAVPGTLAWSAMAGYGHAVFGPVGFTLPAFSEGAMWAFEARATWTAHRHPERPVWHLQLGSWVFAAVGAALNFLGGLTVLPHHPHGVVVGAVKAIASVAGLVAHQLVNLGPRLSRAERAVVRREHTVRKAALRRATVLIDTQGDVRLVHEPGAVRLVRRWHGRTALKSALTQSAPVWLPWPMVLPGTGEPASGTLADMQAAEALASYRIWHSAHMMALSMPDGQGQTIIRPALPSASARHSFTAPERAIAEPSPSVIPKAIAEPSASAAKEPPRSAAKVPSATPSPVKTAKAAPVEKSQDATRARAAYRKSKSDGKPLSDRALGAMFGKSRTWGASRIGETETGPHLAGTGS